MDFAARRRDVRLANALRQHGASFTPRVVAELGQLDELAHFMARDPSILHKKFSGIQPGGLYGQTTLLSIALERADRDMAKFLLDAGAPVDDVVYHGCTLLHSAAIGGDPELVRLLARRGLDVNAKDEPGITPLILAIQIGHADAVAALIESGADVNLRSSCDGQTPLNAAVARSRDRIVEMLLAAGADRSAAGSDGG